MQYEFILHTVNMMLSQITVLHDVFSASIIFSPNNFGFLSIQICVA